MIADAYLAGVSTRRVEKLVQQLGVERMSRSQVSRLAKSWTGSSRTSARGVEARFAEAVALLDESRDDPLAFAALPKEHWRQLWTNNSLERKEIRGCTDVVGVFAGSPLHRPPGRRRPRRAARRIGRRCRYMSADSISTALADPVDEPEEMIAIAAAA